MADPKIKYDIEAAVKGEADADELAKALRNVGDALEGDLQKGAQEAAQALEALATKQRALEGFSKLTNETGALSIELAQAKGELQQLDSKLAAASAATQQFAQAELKAKSALESKRVDLVAARKAYEDLQAGTVGAARKTEEYRQASQNAKANIQQLSAEIKQQSRALKESEAGTRTAQQAENALSAQHEKSSAALIQARGALQGNNAALAQATENMRAAGLSATNLAQSERNLQTAVAQVRQQVAAMAPAYQAAATASTQSTQVQAQNQRTLRDGMASIQSQIQRIQQIATVALGGSYVGGLAKSVAATADEFKNLEARVKLATGEGPEFQAAFEGVTQVALRTNSALDETGALFARLAKAGNEAGQGAQLAQKNALQLTETINQTIQLSGGTADSARAAVTQLIQGLQSGVLRGEEFNSVMEQAPRLAQALANGLGVTTGELRKMANQGALTADVVMKALKGQADVVAGEFSKLPPTVGRALQNLTSQWTLYVGASDNGMVSSANAAKVINTLAANLDTLVTTLQTAGKLWAAIKIAGLANDFGAWALKTLSATTAVEANTVATAANTNAQASNATARQAAAVATAAQGTALAAATARNTAQAATMASLATFTGQATKATQEATVATSAGAVAAGAKSTALGLMGGALRGVTGLLGGPVGLIATALLFRGEITSGIKSVFEWGMSFTDAGQKLKRYEQTQRDAETRQRASTEAIKEQQAALERQAAAQEQARIKTFELSKESVGLLAQFDKLRKDGDSVTEAIGKIGKDFDLSNVPGIKNASAVLDMLLADGKLTAAQFQAAWASALNGKDLAIFEVQARAAFSGAAREGERVAQMLDATVREAVKRSGLDFEQLQGKIGAASRSALNDLDAIVGGLGRLKEEGVDTGRVLVASLVKAIDTADSQKAVDEVRARVESLRKELGNKVADGLLEQVKEKADGLSDALDKALPGVSSLREAMKQLGITSDESLRNTAATSKEAYDAMVASGKASARELAQGFEAAAAAAIAANKGIAPSWVEAEAAARGYKVLTDSAGKSALELAEKTERATGRMAKGWNTSTEAVQAQEEAIDRLMLKYTMSAAQTERQIKLLEREAAAAEKAAEAYRKKWNMDKEGYSLNSAGDRVMAGESQDKIDKDIAERYGAANVGNPDAQRARQLRALGQLRSKGNGLVTQRDFSADERRELQELESRLLNGDASKSAAAPGRAESAGKAATTSQSPPATVVTINLEGRSRSVTTDAAGASVLQDLLGQLAIGRSTAGR